MAEVIVERNPNATSGVARFQDGTEVTWQVNPKSGRLYVNVPLSAARFAALRQAVITKRAKPLPGQLSLPLLPVTPQLSRRLHEASH